MLAPVGERSSVICLRNAQSLLHQAQAGRGTTSAEARRKRQTLSALIYIRSPETWPPQTGGSFSLVRFFYSLVTTSKKPLTFNRICLRLFLAAIRLLRV